MGCDGIIEIYSIVTLLFQFTHPMWGATLIDVIATISSNLFQFTHPMWGATFYFG